MIIRYTGGLGNQLFQYALGKALQEGENTELRFDSFSYVRDKKRKYELGSFNLGSNAQLGILGKIYYNFLFYFRKNSRRIYREKEIFIFENINSQDCYKYFVGNWQNVKYFENIKKELAKEFFLKEVPDRVKRNCERIKTDGSAVMLHVRRGDYLEISDYCVQDMVYYENAMNYCEKTLGNAKFYVFSDDYEWCINNLPANNHNIEFFGDNYSATEDFCIMRCFHHFIISNSTFSWWPAFLAEGGIKIAPSNWFMDKEINDRVKVALLEPFVCM